MRVYVLICVYVHIYRSLCDCIKNVLTCIQGVTSADCIPFLKDNPTKKAETYRNTATAALPPISSAILVLMLLLLLLLLEAMLLFVFFISESILHTIDPSTNTLRCSALTCGWQKMKGG